MLTKVMDSLDSLSRGLAALIPDWALGLAARFALFFVFWRSVQTKLGGDIFFGQKLAFWNISDSTFMLFEYEYAVPLIPSSLATYMATWGEFFFSLGLLFGLLTRLSALGLTVITLVILLVTGNWLETLTWGALLVYLLKYGAGAISLDALVRRRI